MKTKARQVHGVSELLGDLKLPSSVQTHLQNHSIWSKWAEIVGPELFRVTTPLEIKGHTLVVQVAHQAWAQQLHFLRTSILGKVRSICGETFLKDLQFRVGTIESKAEPAMKKDEEKTELRSLASIKLSERQEMTLRAVEDPELRESIREAMQAEARRFSK